MTAARDALAVAVETYRDIGAIRDAIETAEQLVAACEEAGDLDTAFTHYETARDLAQEATFDVECTSIDERYARLMARLADDERHQ